MLEEHEWEIMEPLLTNQIESIKNYRAKHEVELEVATKNAFKPATDKYFELTGFKETNYAAIWHHRLSSFGSECKSCGYLFRTPKANFCANCGLPAKENI